MHQKFHFQLKDLNNHSDFNNDFVASKYLLTFCIENKYILTDQDNT